MFWLVSRRRLWRSGDGLDLVVVWLFVVGVVLLMGFDAGCPVHETR